MNRLLVYGLEFRNSGYVEALKKAYSRYETAKLGAIIDEYILLRISGMQNLGLLKSVDIACYSDSEKEHLEECLKETYVKDYNLIRCQDFKFCIK